MSDQFLHVPLAEIVASLTNPRAAFDPAKLTELAEDINRRGVDTPIQLRPLPGARVADTDRSVKFEIVSGERRYRASQQAGVQTIPARVRDMTDEQALEAQLVENLHRTDLTDLEEAVGYQRLMEHSNITAEQVAERIGKSRTYVYNHLKLMDLGVEGREALRQGKLDYSVAMLVARIPDGKLQIKALKEIINGRGYYGGERDPMNYREAAEHVQQNYMLKLSDARFKITAVDLVPGVGSCKDCSKRTGANPDLFADVKSADVCTDPPCFHKKEEAAAAQLVKEAKAKGQTVIAGTEARDLMVNNYKGGYKGYKRLDAAEDSPTGEPLRKIIGKLMDERGIKPTMLESSRKKGQLEACLPNDVANTLLQLVQNSAKANKKEAPKAVQDLLDDKQAKEEAKAKALYEQGWRNRLLARTWGVVSTAQIGEAFTIDAYRFLALQEARNLSSDDSAALCKLLDLGKVATGAALIDHVQKSPTPDALLLLMIMQRDASANDHSYGDRIANEGLMLVAGIAHGAKLKDVIAEMKSEARDAHIRAEAKKALPANASAARPKALNRALAAWPFPTKPPAGYKPPSTPPKPAVETPADPLYAKAVKVIIKAKKANVRLLKNELGIGTTKALELMSSLEITGKVSACDERGARKVLVTA